MKVQISEKINKYFWTRYIPDSTYKTYVFISFLNQKEDSGQDLKKELMETELGQDNSIAQIIEEKKKVLKNIGFKYPESKEDDLNLLKAFKLIEEDESENTGYKIVEEILRPEEVLKLDEDELKALDSIKFELKHDSSINGILSLVLTNGNKLDCPVSHIINMTMIKISDIRKVLDFLVNKEGSLIYSGSKDISKLKKQDRVILTINEPVFNETRLVLGENK